MSIDRSSQSNSPASPLSLADRVQLAQEIARLVRAKLPLEKALANLVHEDSGSLAQAAEFVSQRLAAGHSLADSLAVGSDRPTRMLAASLQLGQLAGAQDVALERWADYYLTQKRHYRRVFSALVYPILLVSVALLSILYSAWRLLPQYQLAFDELVGVRPPWMRILEVIHQNLWLLGLALVVGVMVLLWRSLARRRGSDRLGVPRNRAMRYAHYQQVAYLCAMGIRSGQPPSSWLGLVLRCVGFSDGTLESSASNDPHWTHALGQETFSVVSGLRGEQISSAQAEPLLLSIGDHLAEQTELAIENEVQRLPVVTSVGVGVATAITYVGLIYLPWIALFLYISDEVGS